MRERDRNILRTVLNQGRGCISDVETRPRPAVRVDPFRACVAVARTGSPGKRLAAMAADDRGVALPDT
eukprot:14921490-Alexandrium_andersonii.AAC.1